MTPIHLTISNLAAVEIDENQVMYLVEMRDLPRDKNSTGKSQDVTPNENRSFNNPTESLALLPHNGRRPYRRQVPKGLCLQDTKDGEYLLITCIVLQHVQ